MPPRPTEPETYVRTPSIPYNYMPRQQTTPVINQSAHYTPPPSSSAHTSDYVGYYDTKNTFFDYNNENYEKKFNDKLFEKRSMNFNHNSASSNFVPFEERSSLIN